MCSHIRRSAFEARTDARHRQLQQAYLKLKTKSDRDAFVKSYATRWSELHRLPYFDLCEMIVVDPMHNLFLGERRNFLRTCFHTKMRYL